MKKVVKIFFPVSLVLIIIGLIVFIISPKSKKINENYFKKDEVNAATIKEIKFFKLTNTISYIQPTINQKAEEGLVRAKNKKEEAEKKAAEEAEAKKQEEPKSQTSNKVMSLNDKANSIANSHSNTTRLEYGTSYQGRPLEAYLIKGNGSNSKTIFMEFEVHGFEDQYAKDGKVLVNLGNDIVEYYANNPDNLGEYQMIVVPSANPDGVIGGVNNTRVGNGYCFGRCTAAGVDMNRDFKTGCFQAVESRALKSLMDQYKMNIHLDLHGWENSVIGDQTIVNTFLSECGLAYNKGGRWGSGQGYVIEFTKNNYGAHSAIVEFRNASSVNSNQVESALNKIMQQL